MPYHSRLLAALLILGLGACAKHEHPTDAGGRAQTLNVGNLSEPGDLDPAYPDSQQALNVILALMEGLAQYDPKTCLPTPAIAERWETSPDGLTWTFHLRTTARWSNGDPVTAHDFVFSYRRTLSPKLGSEYASILFVLQNGKAYYDGVVSDFGRVGARATGAHTLVLVLEQPTPYLAKLICHPSWYPVHRATIGALRAV